MSKADERRERYAAALCEAEGFNWEAIKAYYPVDVPGCLREANAAMTVADEEIRGRLRSEVEELARAGFVQAAGFLEGGIDV